jgi:hypothetical protein
MMFAIAGTWLHRPVEAEWRDGRLTGDGQFVAAVLSRATSAAAYDVLVAGVSLLADDDAFRLTGEVPAFDEAAVERTLRAPGCAAP